MKRRRFLAGAGTVTGVTLAGCSSEADERTESPADSDADGVPDRHDYAPSDPAVQSRSDVVTSTREQIWTATTPTATPAPNPTPSPSPTTEPSVGDLTSLLAANATVQADASRLAGSMHHLVEYSRSHARARIYGDLLENSYPLGAELVVIAQGYPDSVGSDRGYAEYRSSPFNPPSNGEKTVTVDFEDPVEADGPFYYWLVLVPRGTDVSTHDGSDSDFLCESDRLRIADGELTRSRHPSEPDDDVNDRFSRYSAEGCYLFEFSGGSYWNEWKASFTVFKHGYIEDIDGPRYADRRRYVYEALDSGLADELGSILNETAEQNEITGESRKVSFLVDFVQNLPYIPDDVSTGYDDYTKRHVETFVEGGGDCEDSAIMLASLLSSEPFGYGTALILPPGHAAVGIKGSSDVAGTYYEKNGTRYYYVETTGQGWEIGEIPDEYSGGSARVKVI